MKQRIRGMDNIKCEWYKTMIVHVNLSNM
jgi:hypothetical protein